MNCDSQFADLKCRSMRQHSFAFNLYLRRPFRWVIVIGIGYSFGCGLESGPCFHYWQENKAGVYSIFKDELLKQQECRQSMRMHLKNHELLHCAGCVATSAKFSSANFVVHMSRDFDDHQQHETLLAAPACFER